MKLLHICNQIIAYVLLFLNNKLSRSTTLMIINKTHCSIAMKKIF